MDMHIRLGRWTQKELDNIMLEYSNISDTGLRISLISGEFLNTPYKESTLIGSINTPEIIVVNLEGVDCFTFIDYVEALRLSDSFPEFIENIKRVRYRYGVVSFENRNHFFTDWREFNHDIIEDVTEQIGRHKSNSIIKILNKKEDGTFFLQGIQPVERMIKYIPSNAIDNSIIRELKTGDYAGVYSDKKGLDISHVGIIIKDKGSIYLRHASSIHKRVVDEDFRDYMANKPGLIILRARDNRN